MTPSISFSADHKWLSTNRVATNGTLTTDKYDLESTNGALFKQQGAAILVDGSASTLAGVDETVIIDLTDKKIQILLDFDELKVTIIGTSDLDTFMKREEYVFILGEIELQLNLDSTNDELEVKVWKD